VGSLVTEGTMGGAGRVRIGVGKGRRAWPELEKIGGKEKRAGERESGRRSA